MDTPIEPSPAGMAQPFGAIRAYETLFSRKCIRHDGRAHIITLEMFTIRFYLLGFDLTSDTGLTKSI